MCPPEVFELYNRPSLRGSLPLKDRAGIFCDIQSITFLLHISPPNLHLLNFPTVTEIFEMFNIV